MILYPTETLYALGVNVLDESEVAKLYKVKGRDVGKAASWLVRRIADITQYAQLSDTAEQIAQKFLPGPMTLVLPAREDLSSAAISPERTIGFRISSDPIAQRVIERFMNEHDAPLTCTSANVSGAPTLETPSEILQQFGSKAKTITQIIDDGPRKGLASTVVRVIGDTVEVLREGEISESDIRGALH